MPSTSVRFHEPPWPTDDEAKKLVDEFGRVEAEALRLFNKVRPLLLSRIQSYLRATGRVTVRGERYTVTGNETSYWHFADRAAAVAVLAREGLLEMVFEPENAALAHILDEPGLPENVRRELEELGERRTTIQVKVEEKETL